MGAFGLSVCACICARVHVCACVRVCVRVGLQSPVLLIYTHIYIEMSKGLPTQSRANNSTQGDSKFVYTRAFKGRGCACARMRRSATLTQICYSLLSSLSSSDEQLDVLPGPNRGSLVAPRANDSDPMNPWLHKLSSSI